MTKTLLVIGAGRLQLPAILTARRLGLTVVAVDRDPRAPGLEVADVGRAIDTRDIAGVIAAARDARVDGVITICTDFPVRTVAAVAEELGLAALSVQAARLATHKGLMREAFATGLAPHPKFHRTRSLAEAEQAAKALGYPVVVKPPESSGSRGISAIEHPDLLAEAFSRASAIAGNGGEVLIESFVSGPEVSVETLSFAGNHHVVAVTDKRTSGHPHWIETGHVQPSRLSDEAQASIHEAAHIGLRALGIDNSAGHVEIKLTPNGPMLIEIGARLGGDFITTELVPRSTGVDMVEAVIRIALGENPDVTCRRDSGAAIAYLAAARGVVRHISGAEVAQAMPGVVRLEIDVKAGDETGPASSSADRPGFVVAEGADAIEAETRATMAAQRVKIETR